MKRRIFGLVSILLLAAACGQRTPNVITATPRPPTAVPTTEVPSATPLNRPTLPPSWTPAQSWTPTKTPTPTITPTPTDTYTPSKTFTVTQTYTASNTPTPNATNAFLQSSPLPDVCKTFGADPEKNKRDFTFGVSPTAYWTPVDSAAAYLVRLFDANRVTVLTQTTTETSFTFDANLFDMTMNYVWEVAPLDSDGVQICPTRGALLLPAS
jgi:hypothetical protein